VISVSGVSGLLLIAGQRTTEERARTEVQSLAQTVAAALANAVVLKEYAFIIQHCSLVVRSRADLRYIVVTKPDGESLVHHRDGWYSESLRDPASRGAEAASRPRFLRYWSPIAREEVLEAIQPITISEAKWGVIRLGLSAKPFRENLRAFYRHLLSVGGAVLALSLVAVVVTMRLLIRPIRDLTEAARRVSGGDLEATVETAAGGELGELATSFNKMVADLGQAIAAEREHHEQLSTAYAELTEAHQTLRQTQAQLVQSGRLASIGELAAGVAHEINNPLSVVLTYALLIGEKIDAMPGDLRERLAGFRGQLDRITTGAERCKAIADNLLAFSRESEGELLPIALGEIVDRSLDLLRTRLAKAKVVTVCEVPAGLRIRGQPGPLQQVITNLALNAIQAMEGGGGLTLRGRGPSEDGFAELEISDTGPGIAPEHLDKIFDPFFTTKPLGQGTGLGLSIVYGIVSKHGGGISVESEPGRGATFRVRLPVAAPRERAA
jgi:two-component system NtrC family sensor kinase